MLRVDKDSPAERAGFQAGDEILRLGGQPLLSIADVQWVLHNAPAAARLPAEVRRDGKILHRTLDLREGWRRGDISWRATTWDLRRMVTGGLVLEDQPAADRKKAGLSDNVLALRVKFVGQNGPHAAGKNAGFTQGDVFVAVEGKSDRVTDGELMAALVKRTRPGDKVPVTVLRGGQKVELVMPMQ